MPIATTANYKTYAGITGSTLDAQLDVIIPAVQAEMERYCDRTFASATHIELHNGDFSHQLVLKNTPVTTLTSVTRVYPDGSTSVIDSTLYTYDGASGVVSFKSSYQGLVTTDDWGYPESYGDGTQPNFGDGFRNVSVVYVGGYSAYPDDLKLALYRLTDYAMANIRKDPTISTEGLGSYNYSRAFAGEAKGQMMASLCGPFVRGWVA